MEMFLLSDEAHFLASSRRIPDESAASIDRGRITCQRIPTERTNPAYVSLAERGRDWQPPTKRETFDSHSQWTAMNPQTSQRQSLLERLAAGPVICAEGYVFELERRGYLQAGAFVPEVVLEHPEVVTQLHRDFVHAGSDVVEALTYYAHREKLRVIGREQDLEPINRRALELAKAVAMESGALFAGDICNTNIYDHADPASHKAVRAMFEEQVGWAVDAGVDFIVGETFSWAGEALIALDVIKQAKQTAVITLAMHKSDITRDDQTVTDTCKRLVDAGADVVGLNCIRGPETMLPLLRQIRAAIKTPMAALPVPYRTNDKEPTFQSLCDSHWHYGEGERPFPIALDPFTCNRFEIAEFGREALALDIRYLGVCCGAGPHHIRALAEAVGKAPPASKYSADMSKHAFLGSHERIKQVQKDYANKL
jgi:betaine-homocysteine S-methyltransferase